MNKELIDGFTLVFTGVAAVSTLLLFFVGRRGVRVALQTLRVVEAQTEATRDSVDVLINSERAWLLVSDVRSKPPFPSPEPAVFFVFTLKNRGRTAARVTGPLRRKFEVLPHTERLPDVPTYEAALREPASTREGIVSGTVLAPDEEYQDIWFVYRTTEEELARLRYGTDCLYLYISLIYFDFAGQQRELQFCYQWLGNVYPLPEPGKNWILAWAPDAYNKHT